MKRRSAWEEAFLILMSLALFLLVFALVCKGVQDAGDTASTEGLRIAEQSIRRAAVSCYAVEGQYPPDYAYIQENYGVQVDEKKYAVHYEVFASNLMPEITVVERAGT